MKALIIAMILAATPAGIRTEIGFVQNMETIETSGKTWWCYDLNGTEIEPGDMVIVKFDDNGTEMLEDDVILDCEEISL